MNIPFVSPRGQDAVARCERDHGTAVLALATAEAALDKAGEAYAVALGQGRDAALGARRAQSDAEVDRDVARHTVERLAGQLRAAREAATAAEVERLAKEARARVGEFQAAAVRELKSMTASARRLARLWAEASLARDTAIRAGVAEVDMPEVEGFRDVPGLPREVIETSRVTRWVHPWTLEPLDDDQTRRVSVRDGEGYLRSAGSAGSADIRLNGGESLLGRQSVFDRVVYRAAQRGVRATSLMSTMLVPGLMSDDVPGWSAPDFTDPLAVLAHLDAIEGAPPPDRRDRRPQKVELVRVPVDERGPGSAGVGKAAAA